MIYYGGYVLKRFCAEWGTLLGAASPSAIPVLCSQQSLYFLLEPLDMPCFTTSTHR